jgi:hypothetical protein
MTFDYMPSAVVATLRIALGLLHGEVKGAIIAQAFRQASVEELTAFAREVGPEALWDVLITAL